jgi:hypothetical protein
MDILVPTFKDLLTLEYSLTISLSVSLLPFEMFKISTQPPSSALFPDVSTSSMLESHRKHPIEEEAMEVDFEEFERDLGEGSSTGLRSTVTPGEVIASSRDFMRSVGLTSS